MPSVYTEHPASNGGFVQGDSSEATALLMNLSSNGMDADQVGNYLGFTGSLDQDIDRIGVGESNLETGTSSQPSASSKMFTHESEVSTQ